MYIRRHHPDWTARRLGKVEHHHLGKNHRGKSRCTQQKFLHIQPELNRQSLQKNFNDLICWITCELFYSEICCTRNTRFLYGEFNRDILADKFSYYC